MDLSPVSPEHLSGCPDMTGMGVGVREKVLSLHVTGEVIFPPVPWDLSLKEDG